MSSAIEKWNVRIEYKPRVGNQSHYFETVIHGLDELPPLMERQRGALIADGCRLIKIEVLTAGSRLLERRADDI